MNISRAKGKRDCRKGRFKCPEIVLREGGVAGSESRGKGLPEGRCGAAPQGIVDE